MSRVAILSLAFMLIGCSDDNGDPPKKDSMVKLDGAGGGADASAPTAELDGLEPYSTAVGDFEVKIKANDAVTKVELLADGKVVAESTAAPFTIKWDTTKATDGIAKLSLKAYAGTTAIDVEGVPVMVLNNGEVATITEGDQHAMTIKAGVDNHVPVHWTMPDGVKKIVAVLMWDNKEFKMQLDLGTGNCPHSGQKAADSKSDTSPTVTEFEGGGNLAAVMWFAHGACNNESDVADKTANLTFKVFLLK